MWNNNLYLFAQMLFKPKGSVIPPPSLGAYNGEPIEGGFGGMGRGRGAPRAGAPGAGAPGGGMMGGRGGNVNAEYTAKRVSGDASSKGAAGKWVAKDGDNEIKLDLKVEGSKLKGTIENTQMPGAIEIKDGKIEGNNISFGYVRNVSGQDFNMTWTGTLSGDELKLKRELAGGGMGGGRGAAPAGN
ncbi:MAG: hypothetical protein P8Z37_16985 [Acidobacteriota bacterium]